MAAKCKFCGEDCDGNLNECFECRKVGKEAKVACGKCKQPVASKMTTVAIARVQKPNEKTYKTYKTRYCIPCGEKVEAGLATTSTEQTRVISEAIRSRSEKVKEGRRTARKQQRERDQLAKEASSEAPTGS